MAKQQGGDLFGIGDPAGDSDEEGGDYVILQAIPADNWKVVFNDPTVPGNVATRVLGLASFALVEVLQEEPNLPPMRAVRPMVANEFGQVEDVEAFEDFICLVPPGADLHATVDFARRVRGAADKGK